MHWYFYRINQICHIKFVIQVNVYNMHGKQYLNNDLKLGNDQFMMNHHQRIQILNKKKFFLSTNLLSFVYIFYIKIEQAMSYIYKEFLFFVDVCFVLYCLNVLFVLFFLLLILFLDWLCFPPSFILFIIVVICMRWTTNE